MIVTVHLLCWLYTFWELQKHGMYIIEPDEEEGLISGAIAGVVLV